MEGNMDWKIQREEVKINEKWRKGGEGWKIYREREN